MLVRCLSQASVPTPRIRLAAFTRLRGLAAGESRVARLRVAPDMHAAVLWSADVYRPRITVERGPLEIFVGGSQPAADGAPQAVVTITGDALLKECEAGPDVGPHAHVDDGGSGGGTVARAVVAVGAVCVLAIAAVVLRAYQVQGPRSHMPLLDEQGDGVGPQRAPDPADATATEL